MSREFRGLRSATKGSALGTCDLLKKVDQNFPSERSNIYLQFIPIPFQMKGFWKGFGVRITQFKSFAQAFLKACRVKGQRPLSRTAVRETLWTSKEFLFLLLFLLDKGEKEDIYIGILYFVI